MQNLYQFLGIHPTANEAEIQKALVKVAQRQAAPLETLQKIRDTLLDTETRRRYDAALRQHQPDAWNPPEPEPPPIIPQRNRAATANHDSKKDVGKTTRFSQFFNKIFPTKTWHLALICAISFGVGWVGDRLYIQYKLTKAMSQVADAFGGKSNNEDHTKHKNAMPTTWQYEQNTDQMRGITSESASLTSENEANLGFPYQHVRAGLITPKDAGQVIIFTNGQLDCRLSTRDYKGCDIAIRFDNQPVEYISVSEVESGNGVRIDDASKQKFMNDLRHSKKLVIELPMYKSGAEQFTFNVSGYKW